MPRTTPLAKCVVCRTPNVGDWTWQPLGPKDGSDRHMLFAWGGYHYRGFLALHVCDECKAKIERHESVKFLYKTVWYTCDETGKVTQARDLRAPKGGTADAATG